MELRKLKYYEWELNNGKVTLYDKRANNKMVVSLAMIDSISRAGISFRNSFRIEQTKKIRKVYNKRIKALLERLHKARNNKKKLVEQ